MTQNQKDLLLKDISARMPYGVKVQLSHNSYSSSPTPLKLLSLTLNGSAWVTGDKGYPFEIQWESCKPYLFPLSSMTKEQQYEFYCRFVENSIDFDDFKEFYLDRGMWHKLLTSLDDIDAVIDWFHKYHFDYRGLIPQGLATDATDKIIYCY